MSSGNMKKKSGMEGKMRYVFHNKKGGYAIKYKQRIIRCFVKKIQNNKFKREKSI